MAKKKEATLDILLTKVSAILNKDVYIIDYTYCIGGKETNEEKVSDLVLELDPDYSSLLKDLYPECRCIYIKDIRSAKKDLDNNIDLNTNEKSVEELRLKINNIINKVGDETAWIPFTIRDEDYEKFFEDKEVVKGFMDNDNIPETYVSSRLFPKLTSSNIGEFYYKYYKDGYKDIDITNIVTKLYSEIMNIYNYFSYITIE